MLERVFEFMAAATDEFFRRGESELIGVLDGVARFAGGLAIDEDLSGHDGAFGLLTAFTDSAIHQSLIHTSHMRSVTTESDEITLGLLALAVMTLGRIYFWLFWRLGGGVVCVCESFAGCCQEFSCYGKGLF